MRLQRRGRQWERERECKIKHLHATGIEMCVWSHSFESRKGWCMGQVWKHIWSRERAGDRKEIKHAYSMPETGHEETGIGHLMCDGSISCSPAPPLPPFSCLFILSPPFLVPQTNARVSGNSALIYIFPLLQVNSMCFMSPYVPPDTMREENGPAIFRGQGIPNCAL